MSAAPDLSTLACSALHPDRRRHAAGHRCGGPLGRIPGEYEFVTTAYRMPETRDGLIWLACKKCGMWNGFRVVAVTLLRA